MKTAPAQAEPPVAADLRRAPDATPIRCTHCGLIVPAALVEPSADVQFCCQGCRTVYEVIHGCGLDRFYRLRAETSWSARPARVTGQRYAEFDDDAFRAVYCRTEPDGSESIDLLLEGVHCGACVWLVERLPQVVPGVLDARLNLQRGRVRIAWHPSRARLSEICRTLDSLGYSPHPARGGSVEQLRNLEDRRFLIRMAIAGATAGNAMLLAFALYAGAFSGMEPAYFTLLRWVSALIGVIAVAWPGSLFFRGAWAAIRTRTAHIDIPVALGLAVGTASGLVNAALGTGDVYFDSLTMLVFLLLTARWIQSRQQRHAAHAVELLFSITPTRARRVRDGQAEEVSIEALQPADIVEVRAQESVPVDGRVVEGESLVDQSLLTGESGPIPVRIGDAVHAGTVSLSGRLCVRVEAAGEQTRVGQLMRLVEESLRHKAPIVHLADRIAGLFIVGLVILAVLTLSIWLWIDPARAAEHAVALLIVACPCALGLATPLALSAGIGRAARRGILIKGGAALEQLSRAGVLLLDKTGTVTCGQMKLIRWQGSQEVKPLVAALEARASHPIARALREALGVAAEVSVEDAAQTTSGIAGVVNGGRIAIGSREFLRSRGVELTEHWIEDFARSAADDALTPVFVALDEVVVAAAALGDDLRPDAEDALRQLRQAGWSIGLLSGDDPAVVARIAERLGIDAASRHGGVTPEQKLDFVRSLARSRSVVMVGDGVNDAAALAAAHVGIAVHGGTEASFAAADVYLNREGLAPIVELVTAARRTLVAIKRCLAMSLVYNGLGVALAITGLITPLLAAILMPISSLTVVSLAVGVRTFGGKRCP